MSSDLHDDRQAHGVALGLSVQVAGHFALHGGLDGGPVGVETLAAVLSEKRDTIEEVIEPYILQNGLIQRTARGRVLTIEGYKYLGVMPKHNDVAEGELF